MDKRSLNQSPPLQLPPGFRFHPTDEELVVHYLARRTAARPFAVPIIAEVDIYKLDPWDLPDKALFGETEWYFFSPRDRKYPNGARPNRAAGSGYWKATGTDKPICSDGSKVGVKKALVFYRGRAPKGLKTSWIMHEYRLAETAGGAAKPMMGLRKKGSLRLDDWVLCRIYKKHASEWKRSSPSASCSLQEEAVAGAAPAPAPVTMDADDESCLEEVLASLPDIDDSRICLPRLGSFTAMLSSEAKNATATPCSDVPGSAASGIGSNMTVTSNFPGSRSPFRPRSDPVVDNCLLDTRFNNLPTLSLYKYDHGQQQQQQQQQRRQDLDQKPAIWPQQIFLQQQLMLQPSNPIEDEVQSSCKQQSYLDRMSMVNFPGYFSRHKS